MGVILLVLAEQPIEYSRTHTTNEQYESSSTAFDASFDALWHQNLREAKINVKG
jgi:hypothetical protein